MIPDISSPGLKQNHESSNQFMVEWPKRWERIFTYACDPAARQPCILLTHTLNAWWIRLFKAHLDPREETNSQIFVLKVFGRVIKVVIGRHNVKGLVEQITWISIAQDYI